MYQLKTVTHFAAAHQLRGFKGKCESLHGHNWKVEVYLEGNTLNDVGLLMDFGEVKQATYQLLDGVDHTNLNDLDQFKVINPSSENIAHYLFDQLSARLNNDMIKVARVCVWESENSCACYLEE
ncbi:MAG: 6-carboxytetrahydropterin synthase QueD [Deltaproteobacteria bacterium]|nr:6-carboxytetrahydropterin synthase QueD [Deltaproteobacteria bacterium]